MLVSRRTAVGIDMLLSLLTARLRLRRLQDAAACGISDDHRPITARLYYLRYGTRQRSHDAGGGTGLDLLRESDLLPLHLRYPPQRLNPELSYRLSLQFLRTSAECPVRR